MANTIFKITNNKSVLGYPQLQNKKISVNKVKNKVCNQYKKLNEWFGIEAVSDQVWFYGTFVLATVMIVITVLVSGLLYGF
ncbi:DUF3961 domain-containing protein [Bacillus pseudomycoides]|uniref:DUF3961 domain-containing protein n=1 Tax=Bacillus pseudomycoides TaxID=64104 RepID=UPI000BF1363F|nr:DUF3961 domain-containing protein [Bacillus pseudomycoides]PEM69358.1 hypothetical protein CN619_21735 [Bacillus pseudomycoides]PGA62170.1 hypothetical protein COL84_13420 [Bacillus pseudomycoides]